MRLWEKIKSFFRPVGDPEKAADEKGPRTGDLEVTVETVSSAEEPDIAVDIFAMENDDVPADYEDPDIAVEIVEEDREFSDEAAELPGTRANPEDADLIPTPAADSAADAVSQSRMTDEYRAWLDRQLEDNSAEEAQNSNSQKE